MTAVARTAANVIPITSEHDIEGQLVLETHCNNSEQYQALPHVVIYKERICSKTGWSSDRCYACYKSNLPTARIPNPILKYEMETVIKVSSYALMDFIRKATGHEYDCNACEEWGHDQEHRFDVTEAMTDYQQEDWLKFKSTGEQENFRLQTILRGLCAEGYLNAGVYLVTTV